MTRALVVAVLLVAAPARAEDNWYRASVVAAIAAHGADLGSTQYCLGAKTCRELNPWLARFENPAAFGAAKMAVAGLSLWGVEKLRERHPRLATITNWVMAGAFTGVAWHNARGRTQ